MLADELSQKYIDGKQVVKVIVVPKKIVNVVVKESGGNAHQEYYIRGSCRLHTPQPGVCKTTTSFA